MSPVNSQPRPEARRSERIGFDLTLVAELNLNDIKGMDAPSLDARSTTAALAAVTERRDAWLTHGDPPGTITAKVADMRARRERHGLPPMGFGAAGYAVVRPTEAEARREVERITDVQQSAKGFANYQDWIDNTQLEQRVSLEDYSVSNRGLRSGLVGTPEQVAERILEFERAGLDLLLLQFSPQLEEMERFAEEVIPLVNGTAREQGTGAREQPATAGSAGRGGAVEPEPAGG